MKNTKDLYYSLLKYSLLGILLLTFISCNGEFLSSGSSKRRAIIPVDDDLAALDEGHAYEDNQVETTEEEEGLLANGRPDQAVLIDNNFCVCMQGKADSLGNCSSFCSDKNDSKPTLYATANLTSLITDDERFKNLYGWCRNEVDRTAPLNPSCVLQASDGQQAFDIDVEVFNQTDAFRAQVLNLEYDKTYILKLVEKSTGASSTSFQLRRNKIEEDTPNRGILAVTPVHLYTCMDNAINTVTNEAVFSMRRFFYYPHTIPPLPVVPKVGPAKLPSIYCHNINKSFLETQSYHDNQTYPRLELDQQFFYLWDKRDPRFYDLEPTDNRLDINNIIEEELKKRFNIVQNVSVFTEFNWWTSPEVQTLPGMGYVMTPWRDPLTNDIFCPTSTHYESDSKMFQILGEFVGVDTEALYLAVSDRESFVDPNTKQLISPDPSYMIMPKSKLEDIWFYVKPDQTFVKADAETAKSEIIHFHWPPCQGDNCDPLQKQDRQKVFTIKSPEALFNNQEQGQIGIRTFLRPKDKRIACVPKAP